MCKNYLMIYKNSQQKERAGKRGKEKQLIAFSQVRLNNVAPKGSSN